MNRRSLIYSFTIAAILSGLPSLAGAMPLVTLSLSIKDVSGNALPANPDGTYSIQRGQQFLVGLLSTVTDPNYTDDLRQPFVNGRPLGIAVLVSDIITPGTNGNVVPVAGPPALPGNPPTWEGYQDLTPDGTGFPWVNLLDLDQDGDLDVAGTGFGNFGTNLPVNASANLLRNFQYGVDSSIPGVVDPTVAGPMESITGLYQHISGDLIELRTSTSTVTLYYDPVGGSPTAMRADWGATQDGSLFITQQKSVFLRVVPEPAIMLGVGCIVLVAARRRAAVARVA